MAKRTEASGYDALLAGTKPAKGELAAVTPYLEADELMQLRQPVETVGETDGRVLLEGSVVVVVTDRKIVFAQSSGGFRPQWEVFSLPYGHLEPGVVAGGGEVSIPTSGRRSYRVHLPDNESAIRLGDALAGSLRAYRRNRMGLDDGDLGYP